LYAFSIHFEVPTSVPDERKKERAISSLSLSSLPSLLSPSLSFLCLSLFLSLSLTHSLSPSLTLSFCYTFSLIFSLSLSLAEYNNSNHKKKNNKNKNITTKNNNHNHNHNHKNNSSEQVQQHLCKEQQLQQQQARTSTSTREAMGGEGARRRGEETLPLLENAGRERGNYTSAHSNANNISPLPPSPSPSSPLREKQVSLSFSHLRYLIPSRRRSFLSRALSSRQDSEIEEREKEILHDLSGTILPGTLTAIMGPSGAGKRFPSLFLYLRCVSIYEPVYLNIWRYVVYLSIYLCI